MAMRTRLNLQSKLEDLLGSRHVYYQPPENLKIEYPAIIYSVNDIFKANADDTNYYNMRQYQIIVVDKKPDNAVIDELLKLPLSSFDRHYAYNNLNHDVITLYY